MFIGFAIRFFKVLNRKYVLKLHNPTGIKYYLRSLHFARPNKNDQSTSIYSDTGVHGLLSHPFYYRTASEGKNHFVEAFITHIGIEIVEGAGNSTIIQNYQSWDEKPYSGKNYYRLKQTDYDGSFDYSDIKVVDISNAASQLSVFPNPTNGALNFNESLSGNIIVRNMLGEVVWQMAGKDVQSLELSNLSAGSYLLQHLDANYNLSIVKFVISGNN